MTALDELEDEKKFEAMIDRIIARINTPIDAGTRGQNNGISLDDDAIAAYIGSADIPKAGSLRKVISRDRIIVMGHHKDLTSDQ